MDRIHAVDQDLIDIGVMLACMAAFLIAGVSCLVYALVSWLRTRRQDAPRPPARCWRHAPDQMLTEQPLDRVKQPPAHHLLIEDLYKQVDDEYYAGLRNALLSALKEHPEP